MGVEKDETTLRISTVQSAPRFARLRRRIANLTTALRTFGKQHLPNESQHLFALTLVVGVICGLVAVCFHLAIQLSEKLLIEQAVHAPGSSWMVWTVLSPTLGGLFAGIALIYLPGARGSGIPQVKQAFAVEGGRVRFRDALGKFLIGALQIGSGAALGREGPTVQICAGATSLLARATSLPLRNMRRLTPVGVAAGIAAAFNAPIAAVTFTIEEIVGTLDQAVLSGVVIAAALAAVIERGILGVHPVIQVEQAYGLDHRSSLAFYAVLGIAAAAASVAFTDGLLILRRWFRGLRRLPTWAHPAVGGLVTGLLAVAALRFLGVAGVTGGGYDTLGRALAGQLGLQALLALCVAKLLATVFSYGSGGCGGIFAPALFVGAMLGGAVGHLDVVLLNHEARQLGAFALVGMGAVFAGVVRAPITSVLIIFEMTDGYGLVLPLMLANMTAYVIARQWRPTPIYEALLEQDGIFLPHASPVSPAPELLVSDAMTAEVITAQPEDTVKEALSRVVNRTFTLLPVTDEEGLVRGVVPLAELRSAPDPKAPATTLMRAGHTIRSDASLLRAIVRMNDLSVRQLLVVDAESESKLVGVLAMSDLVRAHARAAPSSIERNLTAQQPAPHTGPHADLRASALMFPATVVPASASVSDLSAALRTGDVSALVVRLGPGSFGVVLPDQLTEFALDEEVQRMLIAADVALPAPDVDKNAELPTLVKTMADHGVRLAVVLDGATSEPVGVVTKSALAMAFLDQWATPSAPAPLSKPPSRPAPGLGHH